jgi:hypothetical protein
MLHPKQKQEKRQQKHGNTTRRTGVSYFHYLLNCGHTRFVVRVTVVLVTPPNILAAHVRAKKATGNSQAPKHNSHDRQVKNQMYCDAHVLP